MVIVSQWPSRRQGKEHSEPSRMTVAENIAFLVRDHVRFKSPEYLDRKAAGDLAAVQAKFDTPVLIMGDAHTSVPQRLPGLPTRSRPAVAAGEGKSP